MMPTLNALEWLGVAFIASVAFIGILALICAIEQAWERYDSAHRNRWVAEYHRHVERMGHAWERE